MTRPSSPRAKAWQAHKADAGWAGIAWPSAFGGRGRRRWQRPFFEEQRASTCPAGVFAVGIAMAGPTIIAWGTEEQQALPRADAARRGRVVPAVLRAGRRLRPRRPATRADADGDEWVVNGQKVWTSGAHYSDWGILLARTDLDVPKHRGITPSCSTCARPASTCGRCARSTAPSTSTRCSSPTCAIPDGQRRRRRSTRAGASRTRCCRTSGR